MELRSTEAAEEEEQATRRLPTLAVRHPVGRSESYELADLEEIVGAAVAHSAVREAEETDANLSVVVGGGDQVERSCRRSPLRQQARIEVDEARVAEETENRDEGY